MYDFSTTAHLHFTWRITLEGAPLTGAPGSLQPEGWHTLDLPSIPPRAVADVAVPAPWASVRGALVEGQHGWRNGGLCWREVYLELQACMRSNTPCVPQVWCGGVGDEGHMMMHHHYIYATRPTSLPTLHHDQHNTSHQLCTGACGCSITAASTAIIIRHPFPPPPPPPTPPHHPAPHTPMATH